MQRFIRIALCVALAAGLSSDVRSDEAATTQPAGGADHDAMVQAMAQFSTPGPEHKLLESFIGEWTFELQWWMSPDQPMPASQGTATIQWILDGRFVEERVSGTMSMGPFEGRGLTGYDRMNKVYRNLWLDNMSTGFMLSTGTTDDDGKTFKFTGTYDDPMTGKKGEPFETIMRIESTDKHLFELHMPGPDGKLFKMMQITYMRK